MDNGTLIDKTPIYDTEYTNIVNSYRDMLHSLIDDFDEALDLIRAGERVSQIPLTTMEIKFIWELLQEKDDELLQMLKKLRC